MFCQKCGNENAENAVLCASCGAVFKQAGPQVPNHLVGAILVTLCCCQIFGIVAIVYASQVNSKLAAGDVEGARDSSRKAGAWMWWGFGLGLPVIIFSVLLNIIMTAARNAS